MKSLEEVKGIIKEKLNKEGYELWSFKFNGHVLDIVVERDAPISLDDITSVSSILSDLLDENDFTDKAYTLNVSSLGYEKPIALEKIGQYVGRYVNLHLSNPYKGENILEGDLVEIKDDLVTLVYKDKTRNVKCTFPLKDIDRAKLAVKF